MLVLGGNQATPMRFSSGIDNNPLAGQAQAGLWFGKTDDLWNFGKLQGEGGVWLDAEIKKEKPSDPFFTFKFNNKSLNLWQKSTADVKFTLEADVVGDGVYRTFQTITVKANESKSIDLKESFNPKWIRLVADKDCVGTAYFTFK
jgi:hypothetical protein